MDRPIRLAYVLGHGHSGSTLLGRLLGGHPQIFHIGEALQIDARPRPACGCRARPFTDCSFWRGVEAQMQREAGLSFGELRLDHPAPEVFAEHNRAFLEASRAVTGADVLVDASKLTDRLARLLSLEGLDVRIVSLRRDARGVVCSNVRKNRSTLGSSIGYARVLLRNSLFLRNRPRTALRYEELVANPGHQLERIFDALDVTPRPELDLAGLPRHSVGGNRMRFEAVETLSIDESWREELGLVQRSVITAVTAPVVGLGRLIDPSIVR